MLQVGLIVGSTRQNRFADIPVRWLLEGASSRRDLHLTVLDLREFRLPFFNEPVPPGAARAIEALRGIVIELQMAPIRHEVNIAMEPFLGILQNGRALNDYDYLVQSRDAMLDHLWWGGALKAAR